MLAVSSRTKLHIFKLEGGSIRDNNHREIKLPAAEKDSEKVETQSLSFSQDSSRVAVATRFYSGETKVAITGAPWKHLKSLSLQLKEVNNAFQSLGDRSITKVYQVPRLDDAGITSIPCLHLGAYLHIVLCLSTAHSSQQGVYTYDEKKDSLIKSQITRKHGELEKIQAAVAAEKRFVFVDHNDEVFVAEQGSGGPHWQATKLFAIKRPRHTTEDDRRRPVKVSVNPAGRLSIFYISQRSGYLMDCDIKSPREAITPLPISLDNFINNVTP